LDVILQAALKKANLYEQPLVFDLVAGFKSCPGNAWLGPSREETDLEAWMSRLKDALPAIEGRTIRFVSRG